MMNNREKTLKIRVFSYILTFLYIMWYNIGRTMKYCYLQKRVAMDLKSHWFLEGECMHIDTSFPLLDCFLRFHNLDFQRLKSLEQEHNVGEEKARVEHIRENNRILRGNILFVFGGWALIPFGIGVVGIIISYLMGSTRGVIASTIPIGFSFLVPIIGYWIYSEKESDGDSYRPLPLPVISQFEHLHKTFRRLTGIPSDTLVHVQESELRSIASDRLRSLASEIELAQADSKPLQATVSRAAFREHHNCYLQLGLVKADWKNYFSS